MQLRVLVIDRSEDLAHFVRVCLTRYWPQAKVEAYLTLYGLPPEKFDWSVYQLVIMEHRLGPSEETGFDLLRTIRACHPTLPVVVLTAEGSEAVAVRALKLGAAHYLNFEDTSPRRLSACLEDLLGSHSSAQKPVDQAGRAGETGSGAHSRGSYSASRSPGSYSGEAAELRVPGYKVVRKLADGGMAAIMLAVRAEDQRHVVLKILSLRGEIDSELVRRFMREYELIGKLVHPHVVRIYERGFAQDFAYIAMEHCPAGDLKLAMTQGLPAARAIRFVLQIAAGLGAVHDLGIVHRDLKPSNVLFKDDFTLAIADFGIAKDLTNLTQLTVPGAMLGTPYYASPEQLLDQAVDHRSDLYSLGVILYHMLTGRRPFDGATLTEIIYAHSRGSIPQLPLESRRYQPIVEGLLAKDPDERFQSAADALTGIEWVERASSPETGLSRA